MVKPIIIFWSWQSDHPTKISKSFVLDALEEATKEVSPAISEAQRDIEIDHDTKGVIGFVDINLTIKNKIDQSDHFVADLTPVGRTDNGKALPNPNVMIELGYALATKQPDEITVIANKNWFFGPGDLPFDIRTRRAPITYNLNENSSKSDIIAQRTSLVKSLKVAFSSLSSNLKSIRRGNEKSETSFGSLDDIFFTMENNFTDSLHGLSVKKEGLLESFSIPHAPFSFLIVRFKAEFIEIENKFLDSNRAGISQFSNIGETSVQLPSLSSPKGFICIEQSDDDEHRTMAVSKITNNNCYLHLVNYSITRSRDGSPFKGRTYSHTPLYGEHVRGAYIDFESVASGLAKGLVLAKKYQGFFNFENKFDFKFGLYSETLLPVKYKQETGSLIGSLTKIEIGQELFESGWKNMFESLGNGILDQVDIDTMIDHSFFKQAK